MKLPYRLIALALLCCITTQAYAAIEAPTITVPATRGPITLHVRATGGCDGFWDLPNEAELSTTAPGQLQLIVDGVATLSGDPFCLFSDFTYSFYLGRLPPGTYSLALLIRDEYVFDGSLVPAGSVTFTVAPTHTIPAASPWSLALLALVVLAISASWFSALRR